MNADVTWVDAAQVVTAAVGLIVAGLVAFMPYARRPKLGIEEDADRSNWRVEASPLGGLPHLRLLVSNAKRRRAAQGARILVEGYTIQGSHAAAPTTLGHPSLEWPSTREDAAGTGGVTVFAGAKRPITLGYLVRVRRDADGELHYVRDGTTGAERKMPGISSSRSGSTSTTTATSCRRSMTAISSACSSVPMTARLAPSPFTSTGTATPTCAPMRCSAAPWNTWPSASGPRA